MRIFLDNKGVGFKTVQVRTTDSMYELCSTMEKKIQLQDLTGFGIYEVRDQRGMISNKYIAILITCYYYYYL